MNGYWNPLSALLGLLLVAVGLRFAFPRFQRGLSVVVSGLVAVAAFVPGTPPWLRLACVVLAAVCALFTVRLLRHRP